MIRSQTSDMSTTNAPMEFTIIEFPSQGAMIRGRLYLPENIKEPYPLLIMTHGFTATINGMVADKYAEEFCRSGLAVLLFDHLNFGISDGLPRQEMNKWLQARGYVDALDHVATLPSVDQARIGLWGDSMSGAEVLLVGAVDDRVKAIIAQVPACGDHPSPEDADGTLYAAMADHFRNGDVTGRPEFTIGPLPVVSSDQAGSPSLKKPLTAYRWFMEYGARYGTGWKNSATFVDPNAVTLFHPGLCAKYIRASVLMMIATEDEMEGASSTVSRDVYDRITSKKELLEIDGGHFGLLYHPSELFDQAIKAQCRFLKDHLQN